MNTFVRLAEPIESLALPATRPELSAWLRRIANDIGADAYMLLDISSTNGPSDARIIASSWTFDAVQDIGTEVLARIAIAPVTPFIGGAPAVWLAMRDGCRGAHLCNTEAALLHHAGHVALSSARLRVGTDSYCIVFSAADEDAIDTGRIWSAQMTLSYALSVLADALSLRLPEDPLSERERECMFWVAEGKTTDEVATIVGVSGNTVNGYLAHAMRKLSSANRAMAIATAIRGGII